MNKSTQSVDSGERLMADNNVVEINRRLGKLEAVSDETKTSIASIDRSQLSVADTLRSVDKNQATVAKTMSRLNENMDDFRDFQVQTQTERKADLIHREKMDERLDGLSKDIRNARSDFSGELGEAYAHSRNSDEKLRDKLEEIDRQSLSRYNDIDKKLSVKTGIDLLKQETTKNTLTWWGDRGWKVAFFVACAIFSAHFFSKK